MNAETPTSEPERGRPLALTIAIAAGFIAALLRIVPHPPNFSGIGGLGIFGGARLRGWQAYLFPLAVMMLSDLSLWLLTGLDDSYSLTHVSRLYVYGSFMICVAIGRWLGHRNSTIAIIAAGTLGALQFFVVTNFCEWLFQPFMAVPEMYRYSRDLSGLMTCFVAALGFYQNEPASISHPFMLFTDPRLWLAWGIVGDVFFTGVYLYVHGKLVLRTPRSEPAAMPAAQA